MIIEKDGVFHIRTLHYSYLLRVNAYGQIEHLHFGAPVSTADADAFACKPALGWGTNILLVDGDDNSCPDDKMLEWSGCGRGDYRESPLEFSGVSTDFRYKNWRIIEGTVPVASTLPQPHGATETLELTLEQPGSILKLYYAAYPTALTRRAVLENNGESPIRFNKFMSFCLDLPGSYHMASFHGGWIAEMRRQDTPVGGSRVINESRTGASSNRNNPGFLLYEPDATETAGHVYGFNLIYSGNHYSAAQQSLQGLTRVMQGINPSNFSVELASGERFETPEALLCASDKGFGGLSEKMHRFVNDNIIPEYWNNRLRPVLYNSWEGCVFDFNQRRLLDLANRAKDLGCELFVLDDGWFGKRNNDRAGLGDYSVNRKKLPEGLEGLSKRLAAKGLEFGLWFEPESVNPDSDLYRAHPDWALTDSFPDAMGRHQLLLDLTRPEVRDYIVENVSRILDSAGITYVKWDMNRHSVALGAKAHNYILGLYEILQRIFRPRPGILLESCSSGGNRFDLGMLCFSPQIWCSDNTDPIERLTIQEGLSYLYPQSTFGTHVSAAPHGQTLRNTPLSTRGNVSYFGCLGYELDLKHLQPTEMKEIKAQIAFYKAFRRVFQYGTFHRTRNGWQVSDGKTTFAGVFHRLVPAAPGYEQLRVTGLEPEKRYSCTSLEQVFRMKQLHGAPIAVHPDSGLICNADQGFAAPFCTASGAALESGILLTPQYRGLGYDKNLHSAADFSSNVYILTELPEE